MLEEMHSPARCQVELRRLGNLLPVLGKANSLCVVGKIVTTRDINDSETVYFVIQDHHLIVPCRAYLFCMFAKMRLRPNRDRDSSGKIRVASRQCSTVPVAAPGGGEKIRTPGFLVRSVPLFHSLMLTPMQLITHLFSFVTRDTVSLET